jgi:sterol desaturase/sphingolipid hydroxylase (fatty acid hydroxylase superfamily)
MIHGVHHDHPDDSSRLMMPPLASVPLSIAFLTLFWSFLPAGAWMVFGSGFLFGYVSYDMLHYHFHHHKPINSIDKFLKKHHLRHHFQDGDSAFGVSTPLWDWIFRTMPAANTPKIHSS